MPFVSLCLMLPTFPGFHVITFFPFQSSPLVSPLLKFLDSLAGLFHRTARIPVLHSVNMRVSSQLYTIRCRIDLHLKKLSPHWEFFVCVYTLSKFHFPNLISSPPCFYPFPPLTAFPATTPLMSLLALPLFFPPRQRSFSDVYELPIGFSP